MTPLKPWNSFEDQLARLKARGLHVDDDAAALRYLARIGYYRLSGYRKLGSVGSVEAQMRTDAYTKCRGAGHIGSDDSRCSVMVKHRSIVIKQQRHGAALMAFLSEAGGGQSVGAGLVPAHADAIPLGTMVGAFKSRATVDYIRGVKDKDWTPFLQRLWQRNYDEHIIRDEASLARIRKYIDSNPQQSALDRDNPAYVADQASF
ncbi:MAG: hypothetical protein WAN92_07580 [Herbaspirillum sp.]